MSAEIPDIRGNIHEIEARHAKTTPGIWIAFDKSVGAETGSCTCGAGMGPDPHEFMCGIEGPIAQASEVDAEFIAHAHQDVPWLIQQLKRYMGAVEVVSTLAGAWEEDAAPDEWLTLSEAAREVSGVLKDTLS